MSFDSKVTARIALRSSFKNLGLAAGLAVLESVITESPRAQLNAYGAGRRTLEQQPWVHLRNAVRFARKEGCSRADRKASQDVKVTTGDRKIIEAVVKQFDPEAILNMLGQVSGVDLAEYVEACGAATERLHDRRAKFMPSQTAQNLGVVTVIPAAKE